MNHTVNHLIPAAREAALVRSVGVESQDLASLVRSVVTHCFTLHSMTTIIGNVCSLSSPFAPFARQTRVTEREDAQLDKDSHIWTCYYRNGDPEVGYRFYLKPREAFTRASIKTTDPWLTGNLDAAILRRSIQANRDIFPASEPGPTGSFVQELDLVRCRAALQELPELNEATKAAVRKILSEANVEVRAATELFKGKRKGVVTPLKTMLGITGYSFDLEGMTGFSSFEEVWQGFERAHASQRTVLMNGIVRAEFYRRLGFDSFLGPEGDPVLVLPGAVRITRGWEAVRKEEGDLPEIKIVSAAGISSDRDYVWAYLNGADALLSDGGEFAHDTENHVKALFERIRQPSNHPGMTRAQQHEQHKVNVIGIFKPIQKRLDALFADENDRDKLKLRKGDLQRLQTVLGACMDSITAAKRYKTAEALLAGIKTGFGPELFGAKGAVFNWAGYWQRRYGELPDVTKLKADWRLLLGIDTVPASGSLPL